MCCSSYWNWQDWNLQGEINDLFTELPLFIFCACPCSKSCVLIGGGGVYNTIIKDNNSTFYINSINHKFFFLFLSLSWQTIPIPGSAIKIIYTCSLEKKRFPVQLMVTSMSYFVFIRLQHVDCFVIDLNLSNTESTNSRALHRMTSDVQ